MRQPESPLWRPGHAGPADGSSKLKTGSHAFFDPGESHGFPQTPYWTARVNYSSFGGVAHTGKNAGASSLGQDMPFEEALAKLESIVDAMESGDLPLEQLLSRFEEGTRLVRVCQTKLEEAEVKIQQLEKTVTGGLELKPVVTGIEGDL